MIICPMGDELPVLLVEKLTIQGDQRENHEDAENLHKQGTLGLGSVVRISPMYQPFMSHLEGSHVTRFLGDNGDRHGY